MDATGSRTFKCKLFFGVAVLLLATLGHPAKASENPNKWTVTLSPYIWLPTLEADLKYIAFPNGSGGSPEIEVDPDDLLDNLEMGALLVAEIRKGRWSFVADLTYLEVSSSDSKVKNVDFGGSVVSTNLDAGTEVDVKSFLTTFVVGYSIFSGKLLKTDLVAGARYLWVEAETDWELSAIVSGPGGERTFARSGSIEDDEELWNGIGGIRGQIRLGDSNWFIPYYADIGAGDSDFTWQFFSALAYSFNLWELALGYRHLEFDADDGDTLVQELRFSGPVLGARFEF